LDLKGRKTDRGEILHNDELHSLYSSTNIVRVIKSRRMRWAGRVARMGEGRSVYSDHLEGLDVDGRITLR
jgi:hypothetical protein